MATENKVRFLNGKLKLISSICEQLFIYENGKNAFSIIENRLKEMENLVVELSNLTDDGEISIKWKNQLLILWKQYSDFTSITATPVINQTTVPTLENIQSSQTISTIKMIRLELERSIDSIQQMKVTDRDTIEQLANVVKNIQVQLEFDPLLSGPILHKNLLNFALNKLPQEMRQQCEKEMSKKERSLKLFAQFLMDYNSEKLCSGLIPTRLSNRSSRYKRGHSPLSSVSHCVTNQNRFNWKRIPTPPPPPKQRCKSSRSPSTSKSQSTLSDKKHKQAHQDNAVVENNFDWLQKC